VPRLGRSVVRMRNGERPQKDAPCVFYKAPGLAQPIKSWGAKASVVLSTALAPQSLPSNPSRVRNALAATATYARSDAAPATTSAYSPFKPLLVNFNGTGLRTGQNARQKEYNRMPRFVKTCVSLWAPRWTPTGVWPEANDRIHSCGNHHLFLRCQGNAPHRLVLALYMRERGAGDGHVCQAVQRRSMIWRRTV